MFVSIVIVNVFISGGFKHIVSSFFKVPTRLLFA